MLQHQKGIKKYGRFKKYGAKISVRFLQCWVLSCLTTMIVKDQQEADGQVAVEISKFLPLFGVIVAFRRTTVQWKFCHTILFPQIATHHGRLQAVLSLVETFTKGQNLRCAVVRRKNKNCLELNTCFFVYLHVLITKIHDNFGEPYQL